MWETDKVPEGAGRSVYFAGRPENSLTLSRRIWKRFSERYFLSASSPCKCTTKNAHNRHASILVNAEKSPRGFESHPAHHSFLLTSSQSSRRAVICPRLLLVGELERGERIERAAVVELRGVGSCFRIADRLAQLLQ